MPTEGTTIPLFSYNLAYPLGHGRFSSLVEVYSSSPLPKLTLCNDDFKLSWSKRMSYQDIDQIDIGIMHSIFVSLGNVSRLLQERVLKRIEPMPRRIDDPATTGHIGEAPARADVPPDLAEAMSPRYKGQILLSIRFKDTRRSCLVWMNRQNAKGVLHFMRQKNISLSEQAQQFSSL